MSAKTLVSFFIMLVLVVTLSPACATKKYVRTRVDERVSPLEGRTAELETGTRDLKTRADNLENRTNGLDEKTNRLQGDLTNLDQKTAQGIQEAKNDASQARTDALAETSKVDTRVNGRISSLDNWQEQSTATLLFKLNRFELTSEGKAELDKLVSEFSVEKGYMIEIKGFTDSSGSNDKNRKLSQQRANSVFQYLVEKDVPAYKINFVGLGELKPISDNGNKSGRAENRRVEVRLLVNEGIKGNSVNVTP
jgi:outer membrane protein OmpA-like peptidoglycan-associated protein